MTQRWTLDDFNWDQIDPATVGRELLQTVKTASLVEANSADYVTYLHNVFRQDEEFKQAATDWGIEERQHGEALARWAEIVDPSFSFEACLAHFRAGYRIPLDTETSVRGSLAGELVARCVVESGTSSFYSAIRDTTEEPVLKSICHRIAQDEVRHYKLFKRHLARYLQNKKLGLMERMKIALGRVTETGDDELAYAYFSANIALGKKPGPYDRAGCARAYWRRAMGLYDFKHIRSAAHLILKAVDVDPNGWVAKQGIQLTWALVQWRTRRLEGALAD